MIYAYFGKCELKYFGLFVADNDGSAIRVVEQELQNNKKLADYCSEYSLYRLCDFDEDTGLLLNPAVTFVSDLTDILFNYISRNRRQNEMLQRVSGVSLTPVEEEGINEVLSNPSEISH